MGFQVTFTVRIEGLHSVVGNQILTETSVQQMKCYFR